MGMVPWEHATSPIERGTGGVQVDDGETLAHLCQELGRSVNCHDSPSRDSGFSFKTSGDG
jgi:hypothetical protein